MGTTTSGETIFTFHTDTITIIVGQPRIITASDYSRQVILKGRPVLPIKYLINVDDIGNITYTIIMGNEINNQIEIIVIVKQYREQLSIEKGNDIKGISVTFN